MKKVFFALAIAFILMVSATAQTATIVGPDPARVDYPNRYEVVITYNGNDITDQYNYIVWDVVAETFDWTYDHDFEVFWLTPLEEGSGKITVQCYSWEGYNAVSTYKNIDAEDWVYVPATPDLDGPTTVSVMDTESYLCTPSSGTDYEWIIPFGCTVVGGSAYQKSIKFYTGQGQTRVIQVRYKYNGVWSDYGTISVYVDYN